MDWKKLSNWRILVEKNGHEAIFENKTTAMLTLDQVKRTAVLDQF